MSPAPSPVPIPSITGGHAGPSSAGVDASTGITFGNDFNITTDDGILDTNANSKYFFVALTALAVLIYLRK